MTTRTLRLLLAMLVCIAVGGIVLTCVDGWQL